MRAYAYYDNFEDVKSPEVQLRHVGHMVRNTKPIPGYRAVVDINTDRTFAIVKDGYQIIQHLEVLNRVQEICDAFPEYGTPTHEVWISNYGGRMKTRSTFTDVNFEIGKLPDGTPDTVHPTLETFSSFDTSLAQRFLMGGFRIVCSNGMVVGKRLAEYKRKHTVSLDLQRAKAIVQDGMSNYSEAIGLWQSYAERGALMSEVTLFETLPFHKAEKIAIEQQILKQGKVIDWNYEDKEKRKVEINAWDMYNILTAEASHRVQDVSRQARILDGIAVAFNHLPQH